MKKQGIITSPKDHNSSIELDLNLKEVYKMINKEFRIMILRKFDDMQEHVDRQLKEKAETVNDVSEKFNR